MVFIGPLNVPFFNTKKNKKSEPSKPSIKLLVSVDLLEVSMS